METIELRALAKRQLHGLYWWAHWPEPENDLEKEIQEFVLSRYPKHITLGMFAIADLLIEWEELRLKSNQ